MSQQLINLSPDLKQLADDGYEVGFRYNHLVVTGIPYLNSDKEVRLGTLVSELTLAGDKTNKPKTHVIQFSGEEPCDVNGKPLAKVINGKTRQQLGEKLFVDFTFSCKPVGGSYPDYFDKITTYVGLLSGPAEAVDSTVTARTHRVIANNIENSPFNYLDSASSRAGISTATEKLKLSKVVIIGLGGTGSYILDFLAKTPVKNIDLYDADVFLQHSAFRAPGAPSIDELQALPKKVNYLKSRYEKMHNAIKANATNIDSSNVGVLKGCNFVFLSMDAGENKKVIIDFLHDNKIPFIDVGMGLDLVDGSILGSIRTTLSTNDKSSHILEKNRISFKGNGQDDLYSRNIQVAELNALNAALAIIKYKKFCGFYTDLETEHNSVYEIDGNHLLNEDQS